MAEEDFIYIIDSLRGAFIFFLILICFDIVVTQANESLRRRNLRPVPLRPREITGTIEEDVSSNIPDGGVLQRRTHTKDERTDSIM